MFGAFENPSILILGLGESGLAMARWCARHGCRVRVADTRAEPEKLPALRAAVDRAEFVGDGFAPDLLDGVELVAISPGLSPSAPDTAVLLDLARARGIPVWGEIELFSQALAYLRETSGYAPRILAITGTNGKTTTTRLTGLLCERAGKKVAVAGNISPAVLDKLVECIDGATLPDVWVLELSSFQLETALTFAADAAAVLNLTQDHLDWHGSMDAYAAAKARIFSPRTIQILNRDDAQVRGMRRDDAPGVMTFGLAAPEEAGAFGIARENGMDWLVAAEADESEAPLKPSRRRVAAEAELPIRIKRLMPVDALQVRGMHNAANAMAALALARAIDLPMNALLHALRSYRGEPHRVQHVATLDDVEYYDDSKGTNVGATVAALTGLARRVVLIAGGDGKGQDFAPLATPVSRHARAVVLIGRDAPALRAVLAETGVPLHDCTSLEAAVREAARLAQPGDAILLSPACASLDMFRNYAHRAQVFVSAVRELALERGVTL